MAIHVEFEINVNRRHPVTLNVMPIVPMQHAIEFSIDMWPNAESVAAAEVAAQLQEAFPDCKIDWQAGDEETRRQIERLKAEGAQDVVIMGLQRGLGNQFQLSVQPCSDVTSRLTGMVHGVLRDFGDSLQFSMFPYDPSNLFKLAEKLARAIDFSYLLHFDVLRHDFEVHVAPTPCVDPIRTARRYLPIPEGENPEIRIHRITDWKIPFCRGFTQWYKQSGQDKYIKDLLHRFESPDHFAQAAAEDIELVSSSTDAWIVDWVDAKFQNDLLLAHPNGHTNVALSGAPSGAFGTTND